MAEQSFVSIEIDPDFEIHTSYHEDFFLLRTRVLVDGEITTISSIKEGSYEGSTLNFCHATSTKLWKIANTISPVLHRYGVYHVDTFSYEQSPLFHVVFSSKSCVQKFLLARDEIKSALESQLKLLFSHDMKSVQGDVPETESLQCLSVEVQPDLFLISPNRQKASGAQVHLVTTGNCSTLVTHWNNSKLFDFGSLYQEGAEPPRITTQPKEFKDVIPGKSVTFTIQVTGTEPLSYQWQWRPAGRGMKREEWQSIHCDGSTFQEVEGGLRLTRVMVCNVGYYRCVVCNCAGSETSQSAKLTVVMAESAPLGLAWLDALEGEFDKVFRELHLGLASMPPAYEEDATNLGGSVSAMASVFTQLVCKTKAVFQTNCKLEALLDNAHSELVKAKAEGGSLARELRGRTLQVRSLEVQQKQQCSEQDDTARELGILRAQLELEVEQYSQGERFQEKLQAQVSLLKEENSALHQYVHSLHTDLAASSLAATYLQKELAGRMQQLQLLVKGIRGPSLKKLWQEINTEISLQQNKSLLAAYHSRDKVVDRLFNVIAENLPSESQELDQKVMECSTCDQEVPKGRQVREVTIAKGENRALGMSVTGGTEHGTPILIANMEKGMPAYESRKLQIGDAILSVNGQSLIGRTHDDAVMLLKSDSGDIRLEVSYVVGTTAPPEGNSNPAEEDETDSSRPPTVADLSKSTSLDLKAILGSMTSQSVSHSHDSPSLANENGPTSAASGEVVSDHDRLASSFGFHLSPTPVQSSSGSALADIGLFRYDEVEDSPVNTPIDGHIPHQRPFPAKDGTEPDQLKDASTTPSSGSKQETTTREVTEALLGSCSTNDHQAAYIPSSMSLPQLSQPSPQYTAKPPCDVSKETATKRKYFAPQNELTPSMQSTHYVKLAAVNIQDVSNEEEELPLFCGSIDV